MYRKYVLVNGIRLVCEKIPYVRSVSVGVWIGTGSRNEDEKNNGVSHFIEHMMFKGTEKRTAKEIAETIDSVGGQINAFTGKECTCFYTKTLDEHLELSIELLADMLLNSKFDENDIATEKNVISEEIGMYEDSPEELVHDILSEAVWQGNPLGYPILGTHECLLNIDRKMIQDYISQNYTPENCVIAVAGNFDDDHLLKTVEEYFGSWVSSKYGGNNYGNVDFISNVKLKYKDTEQTHICLGFNGIEHGNDLIYSLLAVNNIFGGGMSSRLFQKIREEKGLVYSIYSYPSSYRNTGLFTIYAGMKPKYMEEVLSLIVNEIELLKAEGVNADDLEKSKEQLKGNYILGLESTSSRMSSIGKSELLMGYINTPEEILSKIDKVDTDSVNEVINKVFDLSNTGFSAVGNVDKKFDLKKTLKLN